MVEINTNKEINNLVGRFVSEGEVEKAIIAAKLREERLFGGEAGLVIRRNLDLNKISGALLIAEKLEAPKRTIESLEKLKKMLAIFLNTKKPLLIREINSIMNICDQEMAKKNYSPKLIESLRKIKKECRKKIEKRCL